MEINGIISGSHIFINPANGSVIDCQDLDAAKVMAKSLTAGYAKVTPIYAFVLDGNIGGWVKVCGFKNGKQSWAMSRAASA